MPADTPLPDDEPTALQRAGPPAPEVIADVMFPALPDPELAAAQAKPATVRAARAQTERQRLKAAAILVLRAQGHGRDRIAKMLGMTPRAVRAALYRARAKGLLDDITGALEHDSLALAVDGLNYHLERKDKDAIFETLKGLGRFRQYSWAKHDGALTQMPPLTVNIITAPPRPDQGEVVVSTPMGTPRED
jgi:hypothetical protein